MLRHGNRQTQPMIATAIRQVFNADSGEQAQVHLIEVVERLAGPAPKVAALLEDATEDLLAFYSFPREHWPKLRLRMNVSRADGLIWMLVVGHGSRPEHGTSAAASANASQRTS